MAKTRPSLIQWASRAAGAVGLVTALLYLGILVGQGGEIPLASTTIYFLLMAGAGLMAWFADRADLITGRRLMWAAFSVFFVIGVLSIFTIGVLFLLAAVLSVFSLSRVVSAPKREPDTRSGN